MANKPLYDNGTALSVTGVSATHARRAISWLRDRSICSFYRAQDRSLNAFEIRDGAEHTYEALYDALDATRIEGGR